MNEWPAQADSQPILIATAEHAGGHTTAQATGEPTGAATGHGEAEHETTPMGFFYYSLAAFAVLVLLSIIATRRLRLIPHGIQNVFEFLVETLNGVPEMVMGPRGRQYAPFIATFFLYILTMNLLGFLPFFKSGAANASNTVGLAIVAFFGVQYFGFRAHGIKYLAHFLGPVPWMAFLIMPLEILSEFIRPVSLSFRLYGNIFGEEQVVSSLVSNFGPVAAVVFMPLQLLTAILQALVFSLLVTVYIALATEPHEEGHAAGEEAPAH